MAIIVEDSSCPIILAVKSVRVLTPSSSDKPLANEISKSLVSKESFFLFSLFVYNSCACSKIISFFVPLKAKLPSLSNFLLELFLTQPSIRQLPGPRSLLKSLLKLFFSFIIVIFEIPPILRKQTGGSMLFCKAIKW